MIGFRQISNVVIADHMVSRLVAEAPEAVRDLALQCRISLRALVRDAIAEIDHRIEIPRVHAVDESIQQAERGAATLGGGITAMMDVGNNGDTRGHTLYVSGALPAAPSQSQHFSFSVNPRVGSIAPRDQRPATAAFGSGGLKCSLNTLSSASRTTGVFSTRLLRWRDLPSAVS